MATKYTRLEIVQRTLSAINGMNVSAVGDTEESEQIAMLLDSVYDYVLHEFIWPHLLTTGNLEVTTTPNQMKFPENLMNVDKVYYGGKEIDYITPDEMIYLLDRRDKELPEVDIAGAYLNKPPRYWTSIDDTYVIFDSYPGSLVSNDSRCLYYRKPSELVNDLDCPDLPERFQTVLLDGVIGDAFFTMKRDTANGRVFQSRFKKGMTRMRRWGKRVNKKNPTYNTGIDYGRKRV